LASSSAWVAEAIGGPVSGIAARFGRLSAKLVESEEVFSCWIIEAAGHASVAACPPEASNDQPDDCARDDGFDRAETVARPLVNRATPAESCIRLVASTQYAWRMRRLWLLVAFALLVLIDL
jgi:hypothetical protein